MGDEYSDRVHGKEICNGFVGIFSPLIMDSRIRYIQGMNIIEGNIVEKKMFYIAEEFHKTHLKIIWFSEFLLYQYTINYIKI